MIPSASPRKGDILPLKINTMPHPGFPTDMQPQMAVLLSVAKGTSIITEGIWENRFRYVDELRKMGAMVQVDGQVAVFEGVDKLNPAPLRASDPACRGGHGRRGPDGRRHQRDRGDRPH